MLNEKLSSKIIESLSSHDMSLENFARFLHNYPDVSKFVIYNEKLSQQLIESIFSEKMSIDKLIHFLSSYPEIVKIFNTGYIKHNLVFKDTPTDDIIVQETVKNNPPSQHNYGAQKKQAVVIEMPCVHYLFLEFKNDYTKLVDFFNPQPFKLSYLYKDNNKYPLFGINLYSLLELSVNKQNNFIPLLVNNTEEFMNFYYEKKKVDEHIYIRSETLVDLFDFKLSIDDLLYDNRDINLDNRTVGVYFKDKRFNAYYKKLNEFNHHERVPIDNLIQYKMNMGQINMDFDLNGFFDFLVMQKYFINNKNYDFCLNLLNNRPELFTPEIMALLCLKNFELHEFLIQHYPTNHYTMNNNTSDIPSLSTHSQNIIDSYLSMVNETNSIVHKLLPEDEIVSVSFNELKTHLDVILNDNGLSYLSEHIEERITFENIISKYIPSILNNYLSIPSHLRYKPEHNFITMTLEQFTNIQKELEKIEVAVISEDIKKMKVFGKFLDKRLGNNTDNIINLE